MILDLSVDAMSENNPFYCSFGGTQYIICDCGCGHAFPSEEALKDHIETTIETVLETEPHRVLQTEPHHELKTEPTFDPTNQELTEIIEYKCGECGNIYNTEEECLEHQDVDHVPMEEGEEVVHEEEHTYLDEDHPYEEHAVKVEQNDEESGPTIKLDQEVTQAAPNLTDIKVTAGGGIKSPTKNKLSKLFTQDGIPIIRVKGMTKLQGQGDIKILRGQKIKRKLIKKKKYFYKRVVCEVCEKKYPSQTALRYHQRVHSGVRPYQCTYCPKTFTMALFLQIHTRTHTGERPYECKLCPKAFTNKAALNRHDRVHTGEKPYACPECGKCFTQSNSMKLHYHTVHLKLPEPYKSQRRRAELTASDLKGKGEAKNGETREIPAPIKPITDWCIDSPKSRLKSRTIAIGSRSGKAKTGVSSGWVVEQIEEIPRGSLNEDSPDFALDKRSRLLPGMRMVKKKEIPKEKVSSNSCSPTPEEDERVFFCEALPKEEEVAYEVIYE